MARIENSVQFGNGSSTVQSHTLSTVTSISLPGRTAPLDAPMWSLEEQILGSLPDSAATTSDSGAVIRRLMEELKEIEERNRELERMNKHLCATMSCVSRAAESDVKTVSQLRNRIKELELHIFLAAGLERSEKNKARHVEEELDFHTASDTNDGFEVVDERTVDGQNNQSEGRRNEISINVKHTTCQHTQTYARTQEEETQRNTYKQDLIQKQVLQAKEAEISELLKLLDNLKAEISSFQSNPSVSEYYQLMAENAALKIQVYEHSEAYRKEHNDHVMLHRTKKKSERDCAVYKRERDIARQQADDSAAKLNRANDELLDLREQLQRLNIEKYKSSAKHTASSVSDSASVQHGHSLLETGSFTSQNEYHTEVGRSSMHQKTSVTGPALNLKDYIFVQRRLHASPHNDSVSSERGARSRREKAPELQLHSTQLQERKGVIRASDSKLPPAFPKVTENDLVTSMDGSINYQRCGAVVKSETKVEHKDSKSTPRYLQCDHAGCETCSGTGERKTVMSSSLVTPQGIPRQEKDGVSIDKGLQLVEID
jgi:hypothetical protein